MNKGFPILLPSFSLTFMYFPRIQREEICGLIILRPTCSAGPGRNSMLRWED